MKPCSICGVEKSLDEYYGNKTTRDGLSNRCKRCVIQKAKESKASRPGAEKAWREANKERLNAAEMVRRRANPEPFRQRARDYAAAHRQEARDRANAWRAANLERARASGRARAREHREENHARSSAWYAAHRPEELARRRAKRAADPTAHRANVKAWKKANPDKASELARDNKHRRRSRERGVEMNFTRQDREELYVAYDGRCAYCFGGPLVRFVPDPEKRLTWDHVIPLSRGGATIRSNMVPACMHCNRQKIARTALEFLGLASRVPLKKAA